MSLQRLAGVAQSVQQSGERFFEALVEQLAELLGLPRAEIWEVTGPDRTSLRPLAIWHRGSRIYPEQVWEGPVLEVLNDKQVVIEQAGFLGTPLVGSNGQVIGCLGLRDDRPLDLSGEPQLVARLFAPMAAAEIERRQAQRHAGHSADVELLATAVHELRDPLTGLVNAADVLRETPGLDLQARWAAAVVDRQSRCLVGLLEDLSTASDLARGKLELRFESVDLEPMVRQAIEAVRPDLAARGQELTLDTALDPVPVWGDGARLRQALTRLLEHVVREAGVGQAIGLTMRSTTTQVSLRLVGPSGEDRRSRSPERHLGLVLVRRLIALHGGTLTTGTPAALEIELQLPAGPAARLQPAPVRPVASSPSRILVVDDEYDSAQVLGRALELRGHRVCIAHNGKAALEALPRFMPDAVVMDIGLPGLDGLAVARSIRATPAHAHLTLIAATGLGWADDRRRSLQAGFDHHLVKPLALEDIEAALAQAHPTTTAPDPGRP